MIEVDLPESGPLQWTVGVAIVALCWALIRNAFSSLSKPEGAGEIFDKVDLGSDELELPVHAEPCLEIALDPPVALHTSNSTEPYTFENERCKGRYLFFTPTALGTKTLPGAGKPPLDFGEYFKGKTRIWELRVQFNFKRPIDPSVDLFFGTELEDYVPLSSGAKQMLALAVGTVRAAIGGLYHTPGDDPRRCSGEVERPCFMLPLWAFDQFMVTEEGEEPPDLMDVDFPKWGSKRCGRVSKYAQEINEMRKNIKVGPTYTFSFWGSSRFGDVINWELLGIPMVGPIDLDRFVGKPPLYCALYSLTPSEDGEKRHLQSRKQYYFRAAIWSSSHRPARKLMEKLVPQLRRTSAGKVGIAHLKAKTVDKGVHQRLFRWMGRAAIGCCDGVPAKAEGDHLRFR